MRMLSSSLTMIELVKLHTVACKGLTAGVWFSSSHRAQYPGCRTWAWPASLLTFWASEWDQVGVCQRLSLSQASLLNLSPTDVLRVFPSAGVTGVLPTEIFNQTARPAAYMIAGSMMWINLFITGMLFPFLVVSLCFCQQENTHVQSFPYNVNTMIYSEYRCTTDFPVAIPLHCYM